MTGGNAPPQPAPAAANASPAQLRSSEKIHRIILNWSLYHETDRKSVTWGWGLKAICLRARGGPEAFAYEEAPTGRCPKDVVRASLAVAQRREGRDGAATANHKCPGN